LAPSSTEQLFEAIDLVVGDDVGEGGGVPLNRTGARRAAQSTAGRSCSCPCRDQATGPRNAKPARTWRSILSLKGQVVQRDDHFAMTGRNGRLAAVDVDVGLTMQRQMIAELRQNDMGEQRRPRTSLFDWQRRSAPWRATIASQARPHVHGALEVGENEFSTLVDVDSAKLVVAAGRAHGASWTIVSTRRWSGKGARFEGFRFFLDGSPVSVASAGSDSAKQVRASATAAPSSNSSISSSSSSPCASSFSAERPKRVADAVDLRGVRARHRRMVVDCK
jgi:hypothetical protein